MIFDKTVVLAKPFDEALAKVKEAFAAEGFGTITEIDMQATLKTKIDKDMEPYVIVGACNPSLAGRVIDAEPQMGALLPCNVVVRQVGDDVMVEAMDPGVMGTLSANADVTPIANDASELIGKALDRLA